LIKTQIEANKTDVDDGQGLIVSSALKEEIVQKFIKKATDAGFKLKNLENSEVAGKVMGNIEILSLWKKN
jgi:predicted rRNA methylase YqxC with S4 and FtsJ domains